ncbi:transposase family protein [Streptomyces sp. NPDC048392]|uniref:transposase family protein n=1 Tax=Streptomyces sp. NPDC048392 TaxID=3365543 RepID=UPI00371C2B9D
MGKAVREAVEASGKKRSSLEQRGTKALKAVGYSTERTGLLKLRERISRSNDDRHETRRVTPDTRPDAVCLAHSLAGLPDPRNRRGRRFPLVATVTAAAAGVLAGARTLTAMAEWIADAPRWVLRALGFTFDPFSKAITMPHPTTVMRLLPRLNSDVLDAAVRAAGGVRPRTW